MDDLDMKARSKQSLRLWIKLLATTNSFKKQISKRFKDEFDCSLARFDMLAELSRCPTGISMGDLSSMLLVSSGNLTGLTKRLEQDGLVMKSALPTDKRTQILFITKEGRASFEAMAEKHEHWATELFETVADEELADLIRLMGKVTTSETEGKSNEI